jgi:hypothetical protein
VEPKPATLFHRDLTLVGLPVACPRQPCPSQYIGGIKLGCSFEMLCSHVHIFVGTSLKEVVPLQVGIEGYRIHWVRSCHVFVLLRSQTHPNLPGYSAGYLVFNIKSVFRCIVVIL